jgi:hypothetical protein
MFPVRLLLFLTLASPVLAGLLPPGAPYTFTNGLVIGEAENYHAKSAPPDGNGDEWIEVPTNAVVPTGVTFENASGGLFMQAQPDNGPGSVPFSGAGSGPSIDYYVFFPASGTYRLYLRWDGHDGSSDSIYAGITELADGIGGTQADWYEDYAHTTSDFGQQGWDGSGQAEANVAAPTQNAMTFTIPGSGIYTLRVVAREDGVALDSFRIQLATMPDPNPLAVLGQNVLIGSDSFTYANGLINGRNGGTNWDFDNTTNNNGFIGFQRAGASTWDTVFGTPTVAASTLTTQDAGAKREFGFPGEIEGCVNQEGSTRYKSVYYRVTMTRSAGATWAGMSAYDFANERIFFGVPADPNPSSGLREFAIGENGVTYTGVVANEGTYTLVSKIDFVNDKISLWINPDLTQPEGPPNATRIYTATTGTAAIRLGSGGSGATTWDDVAVGTSWGGAAAGLSPPARREGGDQIIAREDFDYPDGNIVGHDSGSAGTSTMTTPRRLRRPHAAREQTGTTSKVGRTSFPNASRPGTARQTRVSSHRIRWQLQQCRTSQYKTIYYRFEMQRSATSVSWSGLSLYEGNNERLMFGVPFAHESGEQPPRARHSQSRGESVELHRPQPVAGTKYQIIAKVDYTTGFASLYVNPSLTGGEPGSPNATHRLHECALTALRFGSGGDSPTYWDKFDRRHELERGRRADVSGSDSLPAAVISSSARTPSPMAMAPSRLRRAASTGISKTPLVRFSRMILGLESSFQLALHRYELAAHLETARCAPSTASRPMVRSMMPTPPPRRPCMCATRCSAMPV